MMPRDATPAARPAFNVLWLQSGGCGGCIMSLLCADTTDFFGMLTDAGINLLWHPSLSLESGADALHILRVCRDRDIPLHALCIEGALLRGPHGTGRFHMLAGSATPMIEWVRELAAVADYAIAVGSCAAYGGIAAAGGNPTDACGLQYEGDQIGGLLGAHYHARSGLPVINVAGCPTHPQWVVETLMALAANQFDANQLDALGRPRFYVDRLVHHGCTRNEFYRKCAKSPVQAIGCEATFRRSRRAWSGMDSADAAGVLC